VSHDVAPFDSAQFRQVLGHFPTGVTVVTATTPDGPVGMAVGSFFSVSLEPPLVAFCAGHGSTTWPQIQPVGKFCVNILAEDQEHLCRTFASKDLDKFSGIGWRPGPTGSPILEHVLAWIDCDIDVVHTAGDHDIVVGRVRELEVAREGGPLLFFRGGYGAFSV
jgi:flavin reductase (DIM6/NTAB) family NADH-FMN oxidoreductase RutF